jgi:glycosyltransferase involved in cell wall biosynthesis
MNILRVIAGVDPRGGGPIEGLRLSSEVLDAMGHRTEVVSLDAPDAPGLKQFPYPVHGCGPGMGKYGYTRRLAGWIAENAARFDVAVIHGLWNHASVGGWLGLRRARLPYVMFTHGMLDPWFRETYPLKHATKQAFWLWGQGRVLADAHRVLFTSELEMQLAQDAFWPYRVRPQVVAYGTSRPPKVSAEQIADFRVTLPGLGQRPYLLFLSRIHPKKGCDQLVEAFARLAGAHPEVDLVIAGPDQVGLKSELIDLATRAGVEGRIHWPGMLTGTAKHAAFAGAMAFVLPSHQENFGIVVAEAMAAGTPVLISDKVNIWREVEASGGGLVEADTAEGTYRMLSRFLVLPVTVRAEMSVLARAAYERSFSAEGAARDLAEVLEGAVVGRGRDQ